MDNLLKDSTPDAHLTLVVQSPLGVHARPAARIVMEMQKFTAQVHIQHQHTIVDATSILDIMSLAATQGTQLHIWAKGQDAPQALARMAELFACDFKE